MTRQFALFIHIAFILWLFFKDRKLRPMTSVALWIPLLWIMIIGTRAVSIWFAVEPPQGEVSDSILAGGSPFDRNISLLLIISGIIILLKRRIQWSVFIKSNLLALAFFVFCGISCFWSDYTTIAFKRYTKDIGNVIIALIIITETNPIQAIRAVFARYTYFAVVLSVLFVKYIPELGRYYNRWTYQVMYCGVATEKNTLGEILFLCGIFLIWDITVIFTRNDKSANKIDIITRGVLLAMTLWLLLFVVHSSTSTICFFLGTSIIILMQRTVVKRQIRNLGTWSFILLFLILFVYAVPGIQEFFAGILGRDTTLTGRTDIWTILLNQPINPLIGMGFQSFWLSRYAAKAGEAYYFVLNQAHNGYLETYLHTGLIGLILLIAWIIAAVGKLRKKLFLGDSYAILLFSFIVSILVNNWTESSFNKQIVIWLALIIALLYYPKISEIAHDNEAGENVLPESYTPK